jgi:two-component system, NtrC family, response regulator HydG
VLITGYRADMDQLVAQLLAEGADAVQYKPFDIPDLIATMGKLSLARGDDEEGAL